ncbi:lipopolysaccharide assembly protein LapB [Flammeovirga sp. EKP202]|uniref:tetratricopeptide repeat protein n=1 Tax=Flammeovirga sp. EKP202 TaxID=2770592 RepID=UPI00165FBD2D|nr:hypothetical protein [Flammeovirga sp. EKP202]MBD0401721.1 hypothetical protein [Flammeovirga sp. EKP202]
MILNFYHYCFWAFILFLFNFHSSHAQIKRIQEKNLSIARLAINNNEPHKALDPLNELLTYNLTREGELEVMTLLGKTYSILSLDDYCSDPSNKDDCNDYVHSATDWYNKILNRTDRNEIFNLYTKAELDRFYDNLLTKGVNAFINEDYIEAEFYFDQTYIMNSNDKVSCRYAMICSEASHHYEKALTYSDRLLELGYDSTDVYESRAFFFEQLNQPELALSEVQKGIKKHPSQHSLIYRGVGICIRKEWYTQALDILNNYIKINPFDTHTLVAIGMVYEELDDFNRAVLNYTKAIYSNPYSFDAYFNLGQIQFREAIENQKILYNWGKLKKTEDFKHIHKGDIRKTVKFHLDQSVLNLNVAFDLDHENEEVILTLRNAYGLLNKTKELKRIDDTLDNM